jgi:hypothetical protein
LVWRSDAALKVGAFFHACRQPLRCLRPQGPDRPRPHHRPRLS